MVNIFKRDTGIRNYPAKTGEKATVLKVLKGANLVYNKCPGCKAPHKCVRGMWCRPDTSFHQCPIRTCGVMWEAEIPVSAQGATP